MICTIWLFNYKPWCLRGSLQMLARKADDVLLCKIRLGPTAQLHSKLCSHGALHLPDCASFKPNPDTLTSLLRRCRDSQALSHGQLLHAVVVSCGFELHTFFQNLLIQMYGMCGALCDASVLLLNMHSRNAYSWTFIIRAYAEHGFPYKAFEAFEQMKLEVVLSWITFWVLPWLMLIGGMLVEMGKRIEAIHLSQRLHLEGLMFDNITLVSSLSACMSTETLTEGKRIHAKLLVGSFLEKDTRADNAILSMYSKAGSLQDAITMFSKMQKREVIAWNAIIVCYVINKKFEQAILFFEEMQHSGVEPSKITFITILSACTYPDALTTGRRLHAYIVDVGFELDTAIGNALITMYGICGTPKDAHKVFDDLPQRDRTSWTSFATACIANGECVDTQTLFSYIPMESLSDQTISVVAHATESREVGSFGVNFHGLGCEDGKFGSVQTSAGIMPIPNVVIWSIVMAAYVRSCNETAALELFGQMQWKNVVPDNYVCASVLSACANLGDLKTGRQLHAWVMCNNGFEIDSTLSSAFIHLYGKCRCMKDAQIIFDSMDPHDVVAWTAIMEALAGNAMAETALQHYQQMLLEGVIPDSINLVAILSICCSHSKIGQGQQVHACIQESIPGSDLLIGNALINLYAKCGSLEAARRVFDSMSERGPSTWNTMITGYAQSGQVGNALQLFQQMQQKMTSPDMVTAISVLAACSHGGLTFDVPSHFPSVCPVADLEPTVEHFNSLIDTFGRAGRLDLADHLIKNMPCQPNAVTWIAYLGACKHQSHLEQARQVANIVLELSPRNLAPLVLMANIYAACGQVEKSFLLMNNIRGPLTGPTLGISSTFQDTYKALLQG